MSGTFVKVFFSPLKNPPQPTPSTNSGNTSVAIAQRPLLVTKLRQVPKVPLSSLADFKPSIPCRFLAAAQRAKCGNVVKRGAPINKKSPHCPTEITGLVITKWTLINYKVIFLFSWIENPCKWPTVDGSAWDYFTPVVRWLGETKFSKWWFNGDLPW